MAENSTDKFITLWSDFVTRFRWKLVEVSGKQTLSYPLVDLLLKDSVGMWFNPYEINGRWLSSYTNEHPDKGAAIKNVLEHELALEEVPAGRSVPFYSKYLFSLGGAFAGLTVSYYCGASRLIQAIYTLGSGAAAFFGTTVVVKAYEEKKRIEQIDAYISQLDTYYNRILSILS